MLAARNRRFLKVVFLQYPFVGYAGDKADEQ